MKKEFTKHPTTNIQQPTSNFVGAQICSRWLFDVGCSMLDVSKFSNLRIWILILFVSSGVIAFAQSNNSRRGNNYQRQRGTTAVAQSNDAPGAQDFEKFSGFIARRNIFDPNRYPQNSARPTRTYTSTRVQRSAPQFTLVGTMSYEKGMFAFFDGNNSDFRKVLYVSDKNTVAGYTVTEITASGVTLQSADKKETVKMKIGQMMRQEGNQWRPAGNASSENNFSETENVPVENSTSTGESGVSSSPPSAAEPNDILKKLMQQREQELK